MHNSPGVKPPVSDGVSHGTRPPLNPEALVMLSMMLEPRSFQGRCTSSSGVARLSWTPIIQAPTRFPRKSSICRRPHWKPPRRTPPTSQALMSTEQPFFLSDPQMVKVVGSMGDPISLAPHLLGVTTAQRVNSILERLVHASSVIGVQTGGQT